MRGKRFVIPEDVELLHGPPAPPPSVAFLPPFDPLVWDRPLLGSLFGFDYVWELFLPPAKRRWGWYVLPILFRDRFVGRIEPRIDRDRARVEVLGVWWDDGFAPRRAEGSWTRCGTRSAPTSASPAQAASTGHPTWQRKSNSSPSSAHEAAASGRITFAGSRRAGPDAGFRSFRRATKLSGPAAAAHPQSHRQQPARPQ